MQTRVLKISRDKPEISLIRIAAREIRKGNLVAFPTETVYGLGANALNKKAVAKIFRAKGRPNDNPLIVHISDKKDVYKLAKFVPKRAVKLMDKFWPGPLTIVLKKKAIVPNNVTCGLSTVAVRMPSHKVALALIKESRVPIAAPSANLSGRPSPTNAAHVIADLSGKIPIIISSGSADIGLESTVLNLTSIVPTILRPGKITPEDLRHVIGRVRVPHPIMQKIMRKSRSPGMKYRHYSPKAEVVVVIGKNPKKVILEMRKLKKNSAVIGFSGYGNNSYVCSDLKDMAKVLFRKFREFDKKGIGTIYVEGVPEKGFGLALMNRIKKAATIIVKV